MIARLSFLPFVLGKNPKARVARPGAPAESDAGYGSGEGEGVADRRKEREQRSGQGGERPRGRRESPQREPARERGSYKREQRPPGQRNERNHDRCREKRQRHGPEQGAAHLTPDDPVGHAEPE